MSITIQQAIDSIIAAVPGAPFAETVDTVKTGDATQPLRRAVTTFMATADVIERAAQLGANLIITHEPTFYNHLDQTEGLAGLPVYEAKRQLIEKHRPVIWRFHDYLHSLPPDITRVGMLRDLGWEARARPEQPNVVDIPALTLEALVRHVKAQLHAPTVRVVGDLAAAFEHIAVMPGFPPAEGQIKLLAQADVDVLITGEIHEWETSEAARDALHFGQRKALVVMGHAASEEPGMRWIIPWLQTHLPGVPIDFLPTYSPFQWL